jgi:thioredoxin-like negative regulator of GroEL
VASQNVEVNRKLIRLSLYSKDAILILFGGENCGVCQTIKPQINANFSDKFPALTLVYIDCQHAQEICAQHGVFSLPVVQVFFMEKIGVNLWLDGLAYATIFTTK